MSKIVFLSAPAHGHVNPTLPVVQELAQRGEQVIFYNTEEFRPQVERTGAAFRPYLKTDISSTEISNALRDGNLANVSTLILSATETLLPDLLDELPRQQPDLVIFDSIALWGRMAATVLNLRAASSISHFVFDLRSFMEGGDELPLRAFMGMFGQYLPKLPRLLSSRIRLTRRYPGAFPRTRPLIPVRGGLNIVFTARELQPESSIIDETFRFVGPSINPQTRGGDFPFEALEQHPIVYISLGTVHHGRAEFYQRCFEAFHDYPAQFILSAGTATALDEIPSNFIVYPSVPQLEVLQHVDVFITHGGMNSIHEGLYYGVPLIVIPHQYEQLLNSRVVAAHGVGLVIDDQFTRQQVTAGQLRQAVQAVLSEPNYREAAQAVQQILRSTGGYRQAADEIQAYLAVNKAMLSPT